MRLEIIFFFYLCCQILAAMLLQEIQTTYHGKRPNIKAGAIFCPAWAMFVKHEKFMFSRKQSDLHQSIKNSHEEGQALWPRLHDTVFISYRIGFISDWPSVYTTPFSFHIGLASCLQENARIRYASYRFRVFK